MRKYGRKVMALFLTVTMAFSMAACGGKKESAEKENTTAAADSKDENGEEATEATSYKDTVIWGQGADVTSMDPHQGKETPSVEVTCNIFDTLTTINSATNEIEPQIAESWEQKDDKTYVFKIRQGIKFHDGSDLTAEDVKFSLERAIASAAVSYVVDFIDTVEVNDDYTVTITIKEPYAPILRNLAVPFAAIVPKAVVEKDEEGFKTNPVGSGPYKFVEWKQGDSVKLEAFDDYYAGAPKTKYLEMKVIPEAAQRTIALETGEIDLAYDIIANDLDKVKDNPDLQLFEAPSLSCYYITMNMNKKPFDDERVREAINLAIDRQLLVDTIINGAGEPADAIIAPDVFGYSSPGAYEYDPEKAKELLAEAGYADGFSTSIWVNDNQERKEACEAIQAMLAEIGIDCQIEVMEFGSFIEKTSSGEHDMAYFGWTTSTMDADYTYYSLEHSSQQGAAGNRSFLDDPEVDKLIEEGRGSTDEDKRKEIYADLAVKLKDINNNAPIYYNNVVVGASNKVDGFVIDPIGYHKLDTVVVAE